MTVGKKTKTKRRKYNGKGKKNETGQEKMMMQRHKVTKHGTNENRPTYQDDSLPPNAVDIRSSIIVYKDL